MTRGGRRLGRIQGLVEGLVPLRDTISDRSREGFRELASFADRAIDGLEIGCLAFHVKGSRVGYRTSLPFLATEPGSVNVLTDNRTLRQVVDHVRSREVLVGAILQIHRYEASAWGGEASWAEVSAAEGGHLLAAADQPAFRHRLRLVLHEIITLFPDLDFLFLESESYSDDTLGSPLKAWLAGRGLSFDGPIGELIYDSEITRTTKALGICAGPTWSTEGLAFAVDLTRSAVEQAEETFEDADWHGARGLIYSPDGPGGRYVPVATADVAWWLVPRIAPGDPGRTPIRRRAARQHLLHAKRIGRRVCLLLELAESDSFESEAESRDLAGLAREHLDGLLVGHPGVAADELLRRLGTDGILPTRTSLG